MFCACIFSLVIVRFNLRSHPQGSRIEVSNCSSHSPPRHRDRPRQRTAQGAGRASALPPSRGAGGLASGVLGARSTETARPMTSNRAAGYTAAGKGGPNKARNSPTCRTMWDA